MSAFAQSMEGIMVAVAVMCALLAALVMSVAASKAETGRTTFVLAVSSVLIIILALFAVVVTIT